MTSAKAARSRFRECVLAVRSSRCSQALTIGVALVFASMFLPWRAPYDPTPDYMDPGAGIQAHRVGWDESVTIGGYEVAIGAAPCLALLALATAFIGCRVRSRLVPLVGSLSGVTGFALVLAHMKLEGTGTYIRPAFGAWLSAMAFFGITLAASGIALGAGHRTQLVAQPSP